MPAAVAVVDTTLFNAGNLRQASIALTLSLRHDNRKMDPFNNGGWYKITDLYKTDARWTPNQLFTVVMKNDKQRFQVAVHTVDGRSHKARRIVTKIYAIRCTGGHTIAVDPELISAPLSAAKGEFVSAIVHATMQRNLPGIFRNGLKPGGEGRAARASNFN
eukprot:2610439-Heterocapsa_arctica.AAC.1